MKIRNIFKSFVQLLLVTGSALFTSKAAAAAPDKTIDDNKTLNDRINVVREHLRNNSSDVVHNSQSNMIPNGQEEKSPIGQIWINIATPWGDWNKLWNDWPNWNNWKKWSDWGNFHRDDHWHHDHDDHGHRDHDDHGRHR